MYAELLKKRFEEAQKVLGEREVNLASVTMASVLASLNELGILTQGTVGTLANYFTPRICAYFKLNGVINEKMDIKDVLMNSFKQYNFKDDEVRIEVKGDEVEIEIVTKRCKLCPKGVGGAEIEGSACPVPYFVADCLSLITGSKWEPELYRKDRNFFAVKKEEGKCIMKVVKKAQ